MSEVKPALALVRCTWQKVVVQTSSSKIRRS